MTRVGFVLGRLLWAVVATLLVLTGTFLLVAGPVDPAPLQAGFAVAQSGGDAEAVREAIERYREARGLNQPLFERYLTFVTDFLTLQWGTSFGSDAPVVAVFEDRLAVTVAYLIPAVLLSTLAALAVGTWGAVRDSTAVDKLLAWSSYAGYGVPGFWLGLLMVAVLGPSLGFDGPPIDHYDPDRSLFYGRNFTYLVFPTVATTVTLFAAQLRYVRSEVQEYLREDFVKMVRSLGGDRRLVAKHVLRNAALPLVSVFFTELLGTLTLSVFVVEVALSVPGLGTLAFGAVKNRDVPVVVVCVLFPALVGVLGNFLQDLLYAALDPRVALD